MITINNCPLCNSNHDFDRDDPLGLDYIIFICPTRNNSQFKANSTHPNGILLTTTDAIFAEIGKDITKNSRTIPRDFCSSMISISSGAIGTYIALITLAYPKALAMNAYQSLMISVPAFILLLSLVVFVLGLFPSVENMDPENIQTIIKKHESNAKERMKIISYGLILFIAGISFAIAIIVTSRYSMR